MSEHLLNKKEGSSPLWKLTLIKGFWSLYFPTAIYLTGQDTVSYCPTCQFNMHHIALQHNTPHYLIPHWNATYCTTLHLITPHRPIIYIQQFLTMQQRGLNYPSCLFTVRMFLVRPRGRLKSLPCPGNLLSRTEAEWPNKDCTPTSCYIYMRPIQLVMY